MEYSGGGSSNINLDDYYTKEETDAKYLQKTGGTMTGILNMKKSGDYMCFLYNDDSTIGSIGNDNGDFIIYGEYGNLVLQSDSDVILTASGNIQLEDADVSILKNLTVDGTINFNNNVDISGETVMNGNVTIEGQTVINNDVNINGSTTIDGDLNIINSGALDVDGSSTFQRDVTCQDTLTVSTTCYTNDLVSTGVVEFRTDNIIVGTSGNTITINKAFFDSILARIKALEDKTS